MIILKFKFHYFSGTLLWNIAINNANEKNEKVTEDSNSEKNLLFIGSRESVRIKTKQKSLMKLSTIFDCVFF